MKKLIFTLLLILFFIPNVKADTIFNIEYGYGDYKEIYYLQNLPWNQLFYANTQTTYDCNNRNDCYEKAINLFQQSDYDYYTIGISIFPSYETPHIRMHLHLFNVNSDDTITQYVSKPDIFRFKVNNTNIAYILEGWSDPFRNVFYEFYDSNYNFINKNNDTYLFEGFYDNEDTTNYTNLVKIEKNGTIPKVKDLINYSSWTDYVNDHLENYTTVNLDNYHYVILTLKDYSSKEAFDTNLLVKGMIGITPVYEFGTLEKETITDRCNVSYSDYTDYRLYILKNDLLNNAVYYVKSCQEDSSFKFDSSIFDITYVTTDNVNDPVITFGGVEYNTIPFDKLSNSANQNESNNFIPGATDNFKPFEGVADYVSNFWNSLTTFMSLVTKFFNTLPIEIRAISITGFFTAITLGVIKFIKS